ncbi:endonuclease/exonuclease/phosphatase family protein [Chitinophaga barathri]|uniref:Endonuclease/exonuclease/phosphatase domain-containing protein n=1 Tax=Chitinophaga barathri TaxID=1647451 RepID=A0A3N4MTB3_9BACT|nr:endonuclease/exonuclease/phosphatase family protein [Chitinophaga barathri]RPD38663.1 hypothetical protein EG028_23410 [Chitinophaga barathri]
MKKIFLQAVCCLLSIGGFAQAPVYRQSFDDKAAYHTGKGIQGAALDLGADAAARKPLYFPYVLKDHNGSYSVQCWLKASPSQSRYTALAAYAPKGTAYTGWQLGVQENGAWFWEMRGEKNMYSYQPTPQRQTVRDTKWHQLTYCFDAEKSEASLYYDGLQVAVYFIEGIPAMQQADTLFAGGREQGDRGEWNTFYGAMDEITLYKEVLSPAYIAKSYAAFFPMKPAAQLAPGKALKVMNFNIWHGGNETGKDAGPMRVAEVIRNSGADIVSMQETYGSGEKIADALGYYFYLRGSNLSIMSRFPIENTLPGSRSFFNGGALIRLNAKQKVAFITNWLSYPFDYWDMQEKKQPLNVDTLIAKMEISNAGQLRRTLETIKEVTAAADEIPVIFCGDFNSGSHLDWTEATKQFNNGYVVKFPQSLIMQEAGYKDSFREIHPDPLKERGITWTPEFPNAFKDRIDYIYYKGKNLKALQSEVLNRHPVRWPSDHAAVVTTFSVR